MAMPRFRLLLSVFLLTIGLSYARKLPRSSQSLGSYNVDKSEISVSGISAGGAMAIQFHVAFSSQLKGVASFAGVPYSCSGGNLGTALGACMSSPSGINVGTLTNSADSHASSGKIDATSNLQSSKVFVWTGTNDATVNPGVADKIEDFYRHYGSDIKLVKVNGAAHTQPTRNYGNACRVSSTPYISNCNYDGAYEALNFIHGNLVKPAGTVDLKGQFKEFNQGEFTHPSRMKRMLMVSSMTDYMNNMMKLYAGMLSGCSMVNWIQCLPGMGGSGGSLPGVGSSSTTSMDSIGYAYIPSGCVDKSTACKVHVAFHGCKQGRESIGDVYARHAGYNEVAELNNIIVIYPQVVSNMISNPNGCWDWWAYEDPNFDTRDGAQMRAVHAMIQRVTG